MELKKISRALISVSDKTHLEDLLKILKEFNIEIISTGGTYKFIKDKGYDCVEISSYTGFPEIMDGRVKTLHPKIHGGLLGDIDKANHKNAMQENNIPEINLVVVNLYPFEEKLLDPKSTHDILIENIDIGGTSMLRSSAKNFKHVTVLPATKYYREFIEIIKKNNGSVDLNFRTRMANQTFNETAYYDSMISNWMSQINGEKFSDKKTIGGRLVSQLRYGENPHQESSVYEIPNAQPGFSELKQLQGKELSHNNYLDSYSAYNLVTDFDQKHQICAIIKHNNPCGCAIDPNKKNAYLKALSGDPISAFGGVVAFNYSITEEIAEELVKTFYEVILVPDIDDSALQILSQKKNLRVLKYNYPEKNKIQHLTFLQKTFLAQDENFKQLTKDDLKIVTKKQPTDQEIENLLFANQVCKHVKSNAIVITKDNKTLGIGAGQTSRVGSSEIACDHARKFFNGQLESCGAASDAFFPFADGLEELVKLGVKSIIQPGGSIRDQEVIDAADKAGVAMVFTGIRNFKH